MQVICLGEAMGEIGFAPNGAAAVGVGGDTFNTAVYLARAGVSVGFASTVGTDPFGAMIRQTLRAGGVSDALLRTDPARETGLYSISNDAQGERSFHYWRANSAARASFRSPPEAWRAALIAAPWIYLSGISLYTFAADHDALIDCLTAARARGARLAFDGNYRPRLWADDPAAARARFAQVIGLCDLVLPTFEDEAALWGDATPQESLARITALGPKLVALKLGPQGALLGPKLRHVPVPEPVAVVDTTAAGDSFNAAFLAAYLGGATPEAAALAGHRLAGQVIGHRGALLPL